MTCYTRDENVVDRSIAGETILVPIRNRIGNLGSIYTLNEVGSLIWEKIDGRTPLHKIVESVVAKYHVSIDEAQQDTSAFLNMLENAGLVHVSQAMEE